MTTPNTAAAAFVRAKRAFGPALKVKNNPHLKAKYADLDACLDAVDDALLANGLALLQETSECQDGVIVETVFLHESGESIRCGKLHVPAVKADPQGYGSALTYARRYSLMTACGIAPEDDDGNAARKRDAAAASAAQAVVAKAEAAAQMGAQAYQAFWQSASKQDRADIGVDMHNHLKAAAVAADKAKA
jgi:hypothetical protein